MSEMERNKGKLIPVHVDTEHFTDDDYELYYENGFVRVNGEMYQVQWEVECDSCSDYFADVKINPDGSIDFHTMHYNGSSHWTEVVEDALENK